MWISWATAMHYIMACHTRELVQQYLQAAEESFREIKRSLDNNTLMDDIEHTPSRPLFKRLT